MNSLTVQIVTWNSADALPPLLASLRRQTLKGFHVVVIDNASKDDIEHTVADGYPQAAFVRNATNLGFAGAHNQGFRMAETPYVAVLNPDTVLADDALATMLAALERETTVASVSPKLLKHSLDSGMIDAAGLRATPTRQFLNRGEGEQDHGQYDAPGYVFGASGACAVYRMEALRSVRYKGEFFDEAFLAYKEDVDLSWRLLLAGWKHWYEPSARVAHERRAAHGASISERRDSKGRRINWLSYRNHVLLLMKNERVRNLFLPLPYAAVYEIGKFVYLLFREPRTLSALADVIRLAPLMMQKRAVALRHQRTSPSKLRSYFRRP